MTLVGWTTLTFCRRCLDDLTPCIRKLESDSLSIILCTFVSCFTSVSSPSSYANLTCSWRFNASLKMWDWDSICMEPFSWFPNVDGVPRWLFFWLDSIWDIIAPGSFFLAGREAYRWLGILDDFRNHPEPLFLARLEVCCWLGVPRSFFIDGMKAGCVTEWLPISTSPLDPSF